MISRCVNEQSLPLSGTSFVLLAQAFYWASRVSPPVKTSCVYKRIASLARFFLSVQLHEWTRTMIASGVKQNTGWQGDHSHKAEKGFEVNKKELPLFFSCRVIGMAYVWPISKTPYLLRLWQWLWESFQACSLYVVDTILLPATNEVLTKSIRLSFSFSKLSES